MFQHHLTRIAASVLAVVALTFLTGCSDSHEAIVEDMVDTMNEGADILESVKDEDSAKAAASKLESWAEDMADLDKRRKEIGDPSADSEKELEAKYKDEMTAASSRLMKEMMRVGMDPKLAPHLEDAMKKVQGAMGGKN